MILFFDTSALVKFFHREEGTDVVVSLITDPGNSVWLSELARLEFVCALHRRCRMKEIGEDQLSKAIEGFTSEFSRFNTRKIGSAVLEEAETLVNRFGKSIGLRALDAIHLAPIPGGGSDQDIELISLQNHLDSSYFLALERRFHATKLDCKTPGGFHK